MKIPIFTKGIFLLIALFFTLGIYLSIPVLFNYKSIENIIESKFYSDFNINLNINGDIKYQLLLKYILGIFFLYLYFQIYKYFLLILPGHLDQ